MEANGLGELHVFTDGSFDPSSRYGGWAFAVFEDNRLLFHARGAGTGCSNNSLEVLAVLQALKWLSDFAPGRITTLWTDSAHVVDGCLRWRAIWRNNGWKRIERNSRARRRTIADAGLWQELDVLLGPEPSVRVTWCKGHVNNPGNDYAHSLAQPGTVLPELPMQLERS